jgi:hypothetical protein
MLYTWSCKETYLFVSLFNKYHLYTFTSIFMQLYLQLFLYLTKNINIKISTSFGHTRPSWYNYHMLKLL